MSRLTSSVSACSRSRRGKFLNPMVRDVDPSAEPYAVVREHVVDKSPEMPDAARAAHKPVVQRDLHHARPVGPLFIERVESVSQILEERRAPVESGRGRKAMV